MKRLFRLDSSLLLLAFAATLATAVTIVQVA